MPRGAQRSWAGRYRCGSRCVPLGERWQDRLCERDIRIPACHNVQSIWQEQHCHKRINSYGRFYPGFAKWIEATPPKGLEILGKTRIPTFIRCPPAFSSSDLVSYWSRRKILLKYWKRQGHPGNPGLPGSAASAAWGGPVA